ncbi:MAG TPA: hypothetical protein VIG24_19820 [Acidimicrobiia bacterium]
MLAAVATLGREIERKQDEIVRLSGQRRELILSLLSDGWSQHGIANEIGITKNRVNRIMKADNRDRSHA